MKSENAALIALGLVVGGLVAIAIVEAASGWDNSNFQFFFSTFGSVFTAFAALAAWRSANAGQNQAKLMAQYATDSIEARRPIIEIVVQRGGGGRREVDRILIQPPTVFENAGLSAASNIRIRRKLEVPYRHGHLNQRLRDWARTGDPEDQGEWFVLPGRSHEFRQIHEHPVDEATPYTSTAIYFVSVEYQTPGTRRIWLSAVAVALNFEGDLRPGIEQPLYDARTLARYQY